MAGGGTGIDPVFQGALASPLVFAQPQQGGYFSAGGSAVYDAWGLMNPMVQAAPGGALQLDDTVGGVGLKLAALGGVIGSQALASWGTPTDITMEPGWNPAFIIKITLPRITDLRFWCAWISGDFSTLLAADDVGRPKYGLRFSDSAGDLTMKFAISDAAVTTFTDSLFTPVAGVPFHFRFWTADLGTTVFFQILNEDGEVVAEHVSVGVPRPSATAGLIGGAGVEELVNFAAAPAEITLFHGSQVHQF